MKCHIIAFSLLVFLHTISDCAWAQSETSKFNKLISNMTQVADCKLYGDYLKNNTQGPLGECVHTNRTDSVLWTEVNSLFVRDIGNSLSSCEKSGLGKGACEEIDGFTRRCSCNNIQCFGTELYKKMAVMGTDTQQTQCRNMTDSACGAFDELAQRRCEDIEKVIKGDADQNKDKAIFKKCSDTCIKAVASKGVRVEASHLILLVLSVAAINFR